MTAAVEADPSVEYRSHGWWRDETFLDDLRRQARERPYKLAIAARRVGALHTDTLDYAELARLSERFAHALVDLGVRRGEFVAVQLPNRWEMAPLIFACLRVGAVICPIAPDCPVPELGHRLGLTEARVWITTAKPAEIAAVRAQREAGALEHVVAVGGHAPEGTLDFEDAFLAEPREQRCPKCLEGRALGPDEPFVVLFTSGTTGESKGVLHSQNTIHAAIRGYVDTFLLDESLVITVTTPLVHYSGFGQGILSGVMLGGTVAFQDERRHDTLLDLIERYRSTLLYGPPSTLTEIARAQKVEPRDVSSLRHVVTGSAPVLQVLVDELRETLGARTYSVWGMSEYGPVTITRLDYNTDWAAHSNGRPVDAMEVRIDDCRDAGRRAEVGRLRVRGAARALSYHKRDDVFAAQLGADGWFDTGDVARDDGRGGVRILGRAKDAILRDGAVVPVTELEELLARHPKIREAALIGLPGESEDSICAVLVPRDGEAADLDEVRAHLAAAGQAERHWPDRVEALDALPKTLTGKVRKAELRAGYR